MSVGLELQTVNSPLDMKIEREDNDNVTTSVISTSWRDCEEWFFAIIAILFAICFFSVYVAILIVGLGIEYFFFNRFVYGW